MRKSWNEEVIETELRRVAGELGRMPSANELRASGANDLACAISKRGGFLKWARRLGLKQKESDTHRGQKWERHEAGFFRSLGFSVEEQTTKAPFDLLVNGHRVDVKSATLGSRGWYQFGGTKRGKDCDFFDLVCVGPVLGVPDSVREIICSARNPGALFSADGAESLNTALQEWARDTLSVSVGSLGVVKRIVVPAKEARVVTINMMPSTLRGHGKYGAFVDATHLLRQSSAGTFHVKH